MKNLLIILLSILVWNCSSDDNNPQMAIVESTLIAKGNLFGNGEEGISQQNLVISDQNTWSNLMVQMNTVNNVSYNFTETDIDFSQYTIIAVFNEVKTTGGHELQLNIMSDTEHITVRVTDLIPERYVTLIITQPFHIVKI